MLIASIVGLNIRSTVDMDANINGYSVTAETIEKMIQNIIDIDLNDNVVLKITHIEEIREEAEYEGFRISIEAEFDTIKQILKVDMTTGEHITPKEINYNFQLMFEDRKICVKAYNIETILAEKLEAIISRSTENTRMRDFYDVYILSYLQRDNIDCTLLNEAIKATARRRGTDHLLTETEKILERIGKSEIMKDFWKRYQIKFIYAKGIELVDIIKIVRKIFERLNIIAEMTPLKERIRYLDKKHHFSLKEYEQDIKGEDDFQKWDDYIEWKAYVEKLKALEIRIKEIDSAEDA